MTRFEALFGIKNSQVKKNCLILPLLQKGILDGFNIKDFSRGRLYGVGNNNDFTLIHTGLGAGFVGDAVLYLKETPCQNMILFGSCGLVNPKNDLSLGSLVSPVECYANESFTELLTGSGDAPLAFHPHRGLLKSFLVANPEAKIREVICSTLASLKLEEGMADIFTEKKIDVVDMECSAFFSASNFTGLKSAALFYISDIIKKQPFYNKLDSKSRLKISFAIKKSSTLICEFIRRNLNA